MAGGAKQPFLLRFDRVVGLRSWGLILYGALPANLTVFTTLQKNVEVVDNRLWFLLGVSLLPLLLTFLLIRNRHREWYLTTDRLFIRSALTTLLIVACASLIAGLSGVIYGKYRLSPANVFDAPHRIAYTESYLLGIGSLVISSTLLISMVTKNSELPGLPSPKFVESLAKIREKIRDIQASTIWTVYTPVDDGELEAVAEELKTELDQAFRYTGNRLAKESLTPVRASVTEFIEALNTIRSSGNKTDKKINWYIYIAPDGVVPQEQRENRLANEGKFTSIRSLKGLCVGE
jgi:hypothetical protein